MARGQPRRSTDGDRILRAPISDRMSDGSSRAHAMTGPEPDPARPRRISNTGWRPKSKFRPVRFIFERNPGLEDMARGQKRGRQSGSHHSASGLVADVSSLATRHVFGTIGLIIIETSRRSDREKWHATAARENRGAPRQHPRIGSPRPDLISQNGDWKPGTWDLSRPQTIVYDRSVLGPGISMSAGAGS